VLIEDFLLSPKICITDQPILTEKNMVDEFKVELAKRSKAMLENIMKPRTVY
jgi:hypothetical protein